ncbi:hypothetical protein GW17_00037732 [Ensete ventricosum]|nr:hypothetical protein GW17_00037732 [Ensete ventricosum]
MGILELVLHGGCDKKEEEAEMEGDLPNLSSVASLVIRRCSRLSSRLSFPLLVHLLPFWRAEMLAYLGVENGFSNCPEVDNDDEGSLFYASVTKLASQVCHFS